MCLILSSLLYVREFVKNHPGAVLVLIGVVGEIILEWTHTKGPKAWLKKFFWSLLVLGLTLEFWEAARSDMQVEELRSTNLVLATNLETVHSNNLAQARQLHDLWIRQGRRTFRLLNFGFPDKIKSRPAGKVVILFEKNNPEVREFADEILFTLKEGGWKVLSCSPFALDDISKIIPFGSTNFVERVQSNIEDAEARDGLTVTARNLERDSPATLLVQSFTECSFECPYWGGGGFPADDSVVVFVVKKL